MKRIILIFLISTLLFGCTKVLDKSVLDQMTEDTYWSSATDLELYINQFYKTFQNMMRYARIESNSDNLQPVSPNEILNGTRSIPASGGGWNWENIRKVNYFLDNASKVTEGTPTELKQYKGEGHFFRAYFYYKLVQRFGDLPWYNSVLDIKSKELYASRDPRNEIIDHIIKDLDSAIAYLSPKSDLPSGRLNRACALLLKSRVCLYEGTWEKYHAGDPFGVEGSNGQKYLQLAVQASEKLIEEGSFSIFSTGDPANDYYNLFSQEDLSGNPEVILFETVDPSIGLSNDYWAYLNGSRGHANGITNQLVSDYLCADGLPISISSDYKGDKTLTQVVKNRDPRLSQTMWVPGQVRLNTKPDPVFFQYPSLDRGGNVMSTTGYMVRKGSTTDPEQNKGSSSDKFVKIDGVVFRYAEVLLNYAEAKAELGTLTQADLDRSINRLRDRVAMPHLQLNVGFTDPNWRFPELSPVINEIRRERRVELALEGFRYDDLMRWAAADLIQGKRWKGARFIPGVSFPEIEDKIKDIPVDENQYIDRYQKTLPNGFGFNEKRDYLYPIPTNELTLNENLTQNPGW